MIRVGCAGFSIPQTRYFEELRFLEVQETAVRVPGTGTVSRWAREAPEDFEWTLLAPREVLTADAADLSGFLRLAKTLPALAVVFQLAPAGPSTRASRTLVRRRLEKLPRAPALAKLHRVADLPPDWPVAERRALCVDLGMVLAVDPLEVPPPPGAVAYFRLPGPAGHRSRYEESALVRIGAIARGYSAAFAVFGNADMHSDAKRLQKIVDDTP